jgi:predicted O-linked N-acetylglucosamine transferase (SPINDLY family)
MATPPRHVQLQLAELDIVQGRGARALERLGALDPGDDEVAFLAARAHAALDDHAAARDALSALRSRLPAPSAMLEIHLAAALQRTGDGEGALRALQAAASLDPGMAAAHEGLASLLAHAGRLDDARAALERAVQALPRHPGLWLRLARVHSDLGDAASALSSLARARDCAPSQAAAWHDIGVLYAEYWRWSEAEQALARAAAIDPRLPVEPLLGVVRQELGDDAGALQALGRAMSRDPRSLPATLGERLYLPQVYESVEDAARWRARYAAGLEELLSEPRWLEEAPAVLDLPRTNFLLAYQGEDDLELQRKYSALLARLADRACPQWREPRTREFDGGRRLRIGFAGAIFRDCTAGRYFERWITGLDPARFERFVYHTAPIADGFTRRIRDGVDHFEAPRGNTAHLAARIAADRLDVLVQPEVGMTPQSYLLSVLRLAPVQVAGWGHPVTTGADNMDYFLTCAAMEPAGAAAHYSERLIALPGPGVDYAMPGEVPPMARAALGVPPDARLHACPQSLFKVHPAMDAHFARLLAADDRAVLLFFQAPARAVTDRFARRMQRALQAQGVAPRGQLKFLPRMDSASFRAVLAAADVVLDTQPWSGGNTTLDALAAGTPVVTWPGRFMRGRQTAAMLAMAGVGELAAEGPEGYVALAMRVAGDRAMNQALRERIRAGRGALFGRREPVSALGDAILAAAAGDEGPML